MQDKEKLESRLDELQEEYSKTKDNKATNKHLGALRSKIAAVKKDIIKASKKKHGRGFFVKKYGDATVALVGFPSAGKSTILNALANSKSKIGYYAFTTTTIIPGTMLYKDAHIQVLDMPGIIENAHEGYGGGVAVIAQMKVVDLLVFVIDVNSIDQLGMLLKELNALQIFVNKKRPSVQIMPDETSPGIVIDVNKSSLGPDEIKMILNSFGVYNANVRIWDNMDGNDLIGIISRKSSYIPGIVALNKVDTNKNFEKIKADIESRFGFVTVPTSGLNGTGIESLKRSIYENLSIMRVYLKPRAKENPEPIIVKSGCTVGLLARKLHTEILNDLKCAYLNGPSVKFRNQRVGVNHVLAEGDTITFIKE